MLCNVTMKQNGQVIDRLMVREVILSSASQMPDCGCMEIESNIQR